MGESSLKTEFYKIIHKDEDILDALLFASIEGFLFLDLINFENAWLSSKYWELLGYNSIKMENLEYAWKDIVFEEDLNNALEDLNKNSEDDDYLFDRLLRHRHNNGSIVWMRFRGIVLKDEHGKAMRLAGSFSDASSSMEMEKKMIRLADEYETIFNGTRDAMFLLEVLGDCEFRFIDNNQAHQNKTKLVSEDILKKTPNEVFGKEIGDAACENYQACVKNKKSITYEEKLSLLDGELYWLTTLTPIIEDDIVTKIIGSATDITQMKKLELKLDRLANYDTLTGIPNRNFKNKEKLDVIVSDLTYVNVNGKWNYICILLDLYNREIIGYSAGANKDKYIVYKAFANVKYPLGNINILHTDRGNEFKNSMIDNLLKTFNISRYLSKKGCPYDNAVAEATFKIIKTEFVFNRIFKSFEELETSLFYYVNWYNKFRVHSSLGYLSPIEYKTMLSEKKLS